MVTPSPLTKHNFTEARLMLTTNCNLNCSYCYMLKMRPKVEDMSIENADKIMDFVYRRVSEGLMVNFFGGEPLLKFDVIKHIVEKYPVLDYGLATNGILLDKEKFEFFKKHKNFVTVQFSLDGLPETQTKNRGRCPDYDLVSRMFKETFSTVRIVVDDPWKMVENMKFLIELGATTVKPGIPIFKVNKPGYRAEFLKQLEIARREFPNVEFIHDITECNSMCYSTESHIVFSPDGDIYPCDIFFYKNVFKIGDYKTGVIPELAQKFQDAMEKIYDPDVPCLAHKMYLNDKWINS